MTKIAVFRSDLDAAEFFIKSTSIFDISVILSVKFYVIDTQPCKRKDYVNDINIVVCNAFVETYFIDLLYQWNNQFGSE